MSFPDKALWIIERNSTQPLTLDGIAAACGVSRSHLAHAFGTATGVSVMQYVRARRLSAAALALAAAGVRPSDAGNDAGVMPVAHVPTVWIPSTARARSRTSAE